MPDTHERSFGRYLEALRLEKGISLEDVSAQTRIGRDILIALEREDHRRLPDEVFVKGFLRATAKVIGAEPDEIIRRYDADLKALRDSQQQEADMSRTRQYYWLRLFAVVILLGAIMAASVYLTGSRRETSRQVHAPAEVDKTVAQTPVAPKVQHQAAPVQTSKQRAVDTHRLKVIATKETWLKVIVDGQRPREFEMTPGMQIRLEAENQFNLLVGNAAGVAITLNDKPVGVPGATGQVVALELP